jgi:chromosome segregation ATPase
MRDDSTITKLERRVSEVRSREQALRKTLTEAETERDAAIAARRELLVNGDLSNAKAHATADRRAGDADRQVTALVDAISVTTKQREAAERELAQAKDRAAREREAAWARDRVQQIEQALAAYEAAAQPLMAALHAVENFHGHQLAQHVQSMLFDLKEPNVTGIGALTRDLKIYAADLLAGRASIAKKISSEEVKAA